MAATDETLPGNLAGQDDASARAASASWLWSKGRAGRWRVKLRITIAVGIVFITVAVAASLVTLNYLTSAAAIRAFTYALLDPTAAIVAERSQSFLDACGGSAALASELLASTPEERRLDAVDAIGFALLRTRPELYYVQFGDPQGSFQLVSRSKEGGIDSKRVLRTLGAVKSEWSLRDPGASVEQVRERKLEPGDTYDPRTRPWYVEALKTPDVQWTDVYTHAVDGRPVITAAKAVRTRDGTLAGVASATVSLDGLSAFLRTIRLHGRPTRVFLVDARGTFIASSFEDAHAEGYHDGSRLPSLVESQSPEVAAIPATSAFQKAVSGAGDAFSVTYDGNGGRHLGVLRRLKSGPGHDWIVGAVVAEDDYLGEIRAGFARSAIFSAVVILLFVGVGLLLSGSLARPLRAIASETRRIRDLELDHRPLPDSIFEEVAAINDVYATLKTGLRGFQKYAPVKLVRMLLAEGTEPVLGGRVEELTIFFSDVRSFTSFAESTDPTTLGDTLGRYLHLVAETVAAHGGTVDKFMGDGVMAFWNAPRSVDDHAYRAVLAALRCRDAITGLERADALYTRFGLHTAEVMVGNFGAPDRFAYTVLGDGVNLASRLESINKKYGTQVLVSEATFLLIEGRIECRRIDRIAVKGKAMSTDIYEVLGERSLVPPSIVAAARTYEAGLLAHLGRDFVRAVRLFRQASEERPDDKAAHVLLARSLAFFEVPPPEDWTGVFAFQSK
jgi:adenylate cyclase